MMNPAETEAALGKLSPVSLETIGSFSLMNRIEIKYIITSGKVPDLIRVLAGRCRVLEISGMRIFPYSSTYLDTDDSLFYYQHLRGQYERYKIRSRTYESSGTSFLEIKKKTNKGRTIKWRIEKNLSELFSDGHAASFIEEHTTVSIDLLRPVLLNRFKRITLAGPELSERITIDFDITFSDFLNHSGIALPFLAIVELKKENYSDLANLKGLIKGVSARPTSFSKYCIGNALLNDSLKQNMIKPKLLLLKKLENEYT